MDKVIVSKERIDYTVDLLITMVVDELNDELNIDRNKILVQFLSSNTGKMLYDESTRFWCNGPSYIVETYKQEFKPSK